MAVIEFARVGKEYRRHFWTNMVAAVDDLSFTVEPQRITGFIGPNGAGKTTSLKMLMGLVHPTRGSINLYGRPANDPQSRRRVTFLSEQPYFYEHLTVTETLVFRAQLHGAPAAGRTARIDEALGRVGLSAAANKKVRDMSKGMQQRLNMAAALLDGADLFVMDEPMSGMDPPGRRLFRSLFRELSGRGKTIFFSTHILEDIETLCDSIVVLSGGRKVFEGDMHDVLARGELGTEIELQGLSGQHAAALRERGCEVFEPHPATWQVFVPRTGDLKGCQRFLVGAGYCCNVVRPRRRSLEETLYREER